ncbi:MAG TPA: MFS transporter [Caulobacterales bacterium]|nr:MFS transporter [Caulobacterales bacterium]
MTEAAGALPKHHKATASERLVIGASSAGTVFEWYDFYLYGALVAQITTHFFSGVNETTGYILALGAFAAGFAVRPFGALVFGRIGDVVGRKNTFLVTMTIMGLSTFLVGLLPGYDQWGLAAPFTLIGLRLLQGLALGGEYGGAATYVAEHAPNTKRGLYTSWIQTTATLGLLLSLVVIVVTRWAFEPARFQTWGTWMCGAAPGACAADANPFDVIGWRVSFLISVVLLGFSLWIRLKLSESPIFRKMKEEGQTSKAPLAEAFARWSNLKLVLIALFGAVAGQAVVWYGGQFYALFFLQKVLKVDGMMANLLIAAALAIGTPFFVFFGWLSDKIGRKPIILAGCLIAAATYFPLFSALTTAANPALAHAQAAAPVTVHADPTRCSLQFDPVGKAKFDTLSCDIAASYLAKAGINYNTVATPGAVASVHIGEAVFTAPEPAQLPTADRAGAIKAFQDQLKAALAAHGYPAKAEPAQMNLPVVIGILALLVIFVTMVYGPIAAMLVELFPTRIRYTSMSLPYHIGNGWFGGFLPFIAFAIVAATGNIYSGLWYPVIVAGATALIGLVFLPETRRRDIDA